MSYRVDIADGLPGVVVDQQGKPVPNAKVTGGIHADVTSEDVSGGRVHHAGDHKTTIEVDGEVINGVRVFTSKPPSLPK